MNACNCVGKHMVAVAAAVGQPHTHKEDLVTMIVPCACTNAMTWKAVATRDANKQISRQLVVTETSQTSFSRSNMGTFF